MKCVYCGVDDGPPRACRCPEPIASWDYQMANVGNVRADGRSEGQMKLEGWRPAGKDPRYTGVWMMRAACCVRPEIEIVSKSVTTGDGPPVSWRVARCRACGAEEEMA